MKKLAFTLVTAARKLGLYFQAHIIVVQTDKSLRKRMNNPKVAGRLVLWAIELSEFDVQYCPRSAIKAQALADFIIEFTTKEDKGKGVVPWIVHTDGSPNHYVGGIGVILRSLKGDLPECVIHLQFPMTNNEAEYEAVLVGLDLTKAIVASSVIIYCDFQVIVKHTSGEYEAKREQMKKYLSMVKGRKDQSFLFKFVEISREENEQADHLAKVASAEHMVVSGQVLSFIQYSLAMDEVEVLVIPNEVDWMKPIISYLKNETIPDDHNASRRLKVQVSRFVLIGDVLYKRGFSRSYLRCLILDEAEYVMKEIHEYAGTTQGHGH